MLEEIKIIEELSRSRFLDSSLGKESAHIDVNDFFDYDKPLDDTLYTADGDASDEEALRGGGEEEVTESNDIEEELTESFEASGVESEVLGGSIENELPEEDGAENESLNTDGEGNLYCIDDKLQTDNTYVLNRDETDTYDRNNAENSSKQIKCRNEILEGQNHPETGVPFERKLVEVDGEQFDVVVPKFESIYDAQLPKPMFEATDREQFRECNVQLKNELATNKDLRDRFDDEQLEQIDNEDTPDGYTWHHDAEAGKMQLVDTETHQKTGHTGGRSIWGGGTENR